MSQNNNHGLPLKKVVVPTLSGMLNLFESVKKSGKVFRVDFKKKDGSLRTIVGRCGVKPKNPGGRGMAYNPSEKGLLTVYEYGKGYRMVDINTISFLKHEGIGYVLNTSLPSGYYSAKFFMQNRMSNSGTKKALTSPMYKKEGENV